MRWYRMALRKHLLRFDPRIMIDVTFEDSNLEATLLSFISSSIIKGLDIAGFVSDDIRVSLRAVELAATQNVDLYIIPGQNYKTIDKFDIVVFNLKQSIQPGYTVDQVLSLADKNEGCFTLVYNLTKGRAKQLMNLPSGKTSDFVEIFSGKSYGYSYIETNTYEVISSGAETPGELESNNIYSHIPRKDLEDRGIIPKDFGLNYTPSYLEGQEEQNADTVL